MIVRRFDPSFWGALVHTSGVQLERTAREHGNEEVSATFLASAPAR